MINGKISENTLEDTTKNTLQKNIDSYIQEQEEKQLIEAL
jgi:hypothetical protein